MVKCNLSRLLGERKWTQAHLARKTKIRANTISDLYNEFADRVSLSQLAQICDVLECDLSELLEYTPGSNKDRK